MSKHTPGPWNHNGFGRIYKGKSYECGQSLIATVASDEWVNEEESLVNARLIVTACNHFDEMYEALKQLLMEWDVSVEYNKAGYALNRADITQNTINKARSILTKIEEV